MPVALQHFIQTALNLIDTVMIGRVSKDALAAVGLANQVFFLMILLVFGINSGVSVYIAQFWGGKKMTTPIFERLWELVLLVECLLV